MQDLWLLANAPVPMKFPKDGHLSAALEELLTGVYDEQGSNVVKYLSQTPSNASLSLKLQFQGEQLVAASLFYRES